MKRILILIMISTLTFILQSVPSFSSNTLNSTTTSLTVGATTKKAELSYSLPASVVLGSSTNIVWEVSEISTSDEFGNLSLSQGGYDCQFGGAAENLVRCVLSSSGREATVSLESAVVAKYKVVVSATVGQSKYSNEQNVEFLLGQDRKPLKYAPPNKSPSIIYQSPDVGRDLQTNVKVKVENVSGVEVKDKNSYVSGPFWTSMVVVDSRGRGVENAYNNVASANQNCYVYFQEILDTSDRACSWINIPVTYSNWAKWGGLFLKVTWAINAGTGQNKYARFSKTYEVPINFPRALPSAEASCGDVFKDMESSCNIKLVYKDALGSISVGPDRKVNWKLRDASGSLIQQKEEMVSINNPLVIVLPESMLELTLELTLEGESRPTLVKAKVFDYAREALDSLSLDLDCASTFRNGKVTCTLTSYSLYDDNEKFPIRIQARVDGRSWKTLKTSSMRLNGEFDFEVPAQMKNSYELRAAIKFNGQNVYSESQEWYVRKPSLSLSQIENLLRRSLNVNCNSLPTNFKKFVFQRKGQTFNNYGSILTIYGLGSLRISVLDSSGSLRWGPASSFDEGILDAWNCRYPASVKK